MAKANINLYRTEGRMHQYVYYCVQSVKDHALRSAAINRYIAEYKLSDADQQKLAELLVELDEARATKPPKPKTGYRHRTPEEEEEDEEMQLRIWKDEQRGD